MPTPSARARLTSHTAKQEHPRAECPQGTPRLSAGLGKQLAEPAPQPDSLSGPVFAPPHPKLTASTTSQHWSWELLGAAAP